MGITIAQWQPELASGDALVDEQHQSLFSTINALNTALLEGYSQDLLEQILDSLKDYTSVHFDTEEQFMRQHSYPGYEEHCRKHKTLKAKVLDFEAEHNRNFPSLAIAISHFLADWLIQHIKTEDLKMIRFCRQGQWTEVTPDLQVPPVQTSGMIAQWRPEYETGYALIDDQHRSLFHAINALNSAMLEGRAEALLDRTLKSLRTYTTLHFDTEEQFMLKYSYPEYTEHKAKHTLLRNHVEQFNQQARLQTSKQLTITVSHFLTDWLIHHIKDEDQKMITFLRQERQKDHSSHPVNSI